MTPRGSRLYRAVLWAFSLPLLCSLAISAATVVYLVQTLLIRQVQAKVATDLRSAREIYDARLERLEDLVRLGANLVPVRDALERGDAAALTSVLQALRIRGDLDLLTATGPDGRVLARARNPSAVGDDARHLGPVRAALVGATVASTEILEESDLRREGDDLAEQCRIELVPTPRARPVDATRLARAMSLFAAAPVLDASGRVVGVLYGADVLNRDYALVDKIRATVFGNTEFQGRAVGTATLFLGDVRISTNVPERGGRRAVGTRVSAEVADRVLDQGKPWIDRAFVVNDWYLSAYEPLLDSRDRTVGILYVGLLERPYRTLVWKSLWAVAGFHLAGVGLGFVLLTAVLRRRVRAPLRVLSEGVRRVAEGDLAHEIRIDLEDEIGEVAREFNAMTRALRERDREIEALTQGLEEKVRERSAELERRNRDLQRARAEVLEMMERQKATNRELEASLRRLRETQEELVRSGRLAALGAMAAGVAHEINNPLATIQGNLDILELKIRRGLDCGEELARLRSQAERMRGIVVNLLTLAREHRAEVEPTDPLAVARRVRAEKEPKARAKGVRLEDEGPEALPPVAANPGRLAQVFENLLENALEATPEGGTVTLRAGADEAAVWVAVADTGPGVPPEHREKIWNPFYTTRGSGTGLGLSIAHALVEEHKGQIRLDCPPEGGAVFTVTLPRAG
ncbi:MAG: HAMP domain-containing protein [Candidatus Dadabacteria bacterium]|nr:MAG: HAMP domain-containing protein [Candidatus Dadabacteria bacterium]